jgi:hypothetical protein
VTLAHPVLDAATLAIAIVTLTVFLIGAFWRPLIFLILGMILTLVAHVMSGWTNLTHTYYYGHPLELILDWSFVSVALGFYLRRQQITSGAI